MEFFRRLIGRIPPRYALKDPVCSHKQLQPHPQGSRGCSCLTYFRNLNGLPGSSDLKVCNINFTNISNHYQNQNECNECYSFKKLDMCIGQSLDITTSTLILLLYQFIIKINEMNWMLSTPLIENVNISYILGKYTFAFSF